MSRRVLARPLAAATLAAALVLTPALATADPGNGKGGGQEQAPGQQKDKTEKDKAPKDKGEKGGQQGGGKAEAPGQQKEPGQPATGKGQDKGQDNGQGGDKGPQGPKPGKGPQTGTSGAGGGNGNGGGDGGGEGGDNGDPAGNNGTVKIAELGELDGIPNNTPHPGCTFQVEWYGFDEGEDIVSTVTFAAQAPTSDVVIGGTEPSQVPVGGDAASGAGTETGLDAVQAYTLTFDGEPHPKQGYHVKLTVETPGSIGNDTKTKVFWVAPCEEEAVGGTEEGSDDETTDEETTAEEAGVAGTQDSQDQGVLGTQLSAGTQAGSDDTASEGAAVPTNIDAGADGPFAGLTDSPWPLVALLGGLLAALGAFVVRRRAGA